MHNDPFSNKPCERPSPFCRKINPIFATVPKKNKLRAACTKWHPLGREPRSRTAQLFHTSANCISTARSDIAPTQPQYSSKKTNLVPHVRVKRHTCISPTQCIFTQYTHIPNIHTTMRPMLLTQSAPINRKRRPSPKALTAMPVAVDRCDV